MRFLTVIFILLLLTLIATGSFYLYYNFIPDKPMDLRILKQDIAGIEIKNTSGNLQFYPNMRFSKLPISYSIESNCPIETQIRVDKAFNIVEDLTDLKFSKLIYDGDITLHCSKDVKKEGPTFIAGEGGPTRIINTSHYSVIEEGSILLFKSKICPEPLVEIHELFHALGFDHVDDKNDIMYPVTDCNQEISQEIINEINSLYSEKSLAELEFNNVTGTRNGPYLDFRVEIRNQGLLDSEPTTLSVYNGDNKAKDFKIESIELGAGRILIVESLRVGRGDSIKFVIDPENVIEELNENNNVIILS